MDKPGTDAKPARGNPGRFMFARLLLQRRELGFDFGAVVSFR